MFSKKIGDNNLSVTMDEAVQKDLVGRGVRPAEIYSLIVSFADKLLVTKKDNELFLTNDQTGAKLVLEMKWASEKNVTLYVTKTFNIGDDRDRRVNLTPHSEEVSHAI
ncbi:hypothetical protein Ga0466249_003466 [Sporomusaceae bacterium BoRhaA]|uniref:hypothetical protein n=1 Tax=Pelorhabdus rhamnosifermentans TaxID=2772457 RepID=UPI001C06053A|nr:hypothetical protein [Pelorhabdus rhamnosifermentans]MBU2702339.1 hypothetical protein [Pelorhabdus rhamnosifermentans]